MDNQREIMQENGQVAARIRSELIQAARPEITTLKLDELAVKLFKQYGVMASFKDFEGYPYHIVTCVNDEVVHGMPSNRKLREGDLLTVDLGVYHQGFHVDTARTVKIPSSKFQIPNKSQITNNNFLNVGRKALETAIRRATPNNRVGDISNAMQGVIEDAGYSVIRAYVGHGVGKSLHEPPQIPCYGKAGTGPKLKKGQALAVEIMYTQGEFNIDLLDNGWTTVTRDGSLAAMFEDTVIVDSSPLVVTA